MNKQDKEETDSRKVLLKKYWKYLNVFLKKASDKLSEHNSLDYHIELERDLKKILWNPPLYQMLTDKLKAVKKYLKDNLNKGFIQINSVLIVSSVLFVWKSKEGLRFYINYRKLNVIIKKNQYLLFLIEETLIRIIKIK